MTVLRFEVLYYTAALVLMCGFVLAAAMAIGTIDSPGPAGEGLVKGGQGASNVLPPAGPGVPASVLVGLAETALLCGRVQAACRG